MAVMSPAVLEQAAKAELARAHARPDDARIPRRRTKAPRAAVKLRVEAESVREEKSELMALGILPAGWRASRSFPTHWF